MLVEQRRELRQIGGRKGGGTPNRPNHNVHNIEELHIMAKTIVAPTGADLSKLIQSASEAVQEVGKLLDKVYSVASAGQAFTGEEGGTEHNLFRVIEDLTSNTSALQFASRALSEAAAAAKGVHHA